ncbi:hypothetical protein LTR56_025095 [Elasticomyces elasticus]|nr:hypothetical protein LTR56_025095 [Elasticomyces elasticus]KAK3663249.1 hypothetical protein LTR22_005907 [Elasticomyces elasticus]KAK4929094.1 hypothetical protein LTR49_004291 [Elasticomyces elasticus]KAK5766473.1 hypothetical protein LTS12_003390 [Elasticomyces elasticus]
MAIADVVPQNMPSTSTIILIASVVAAMFLGFLLREMCERLDLEFKGMYRRPAIVQLEYIRKPSLLLALPPELRNRIWEYVLVSPKKIVINKDTWKQPPLVRTCKQTRTEAGPMYYRQNKFAMIHTDLDFPANVNFCKAAKSLVQIMKHVEMTYFGGPAGQANWESLLKGAKAVHAGLIRQVGPNAQVMGMHAAAIGALRMAHALRGAKWEEVKKSLEEYKEAVARSGVAWNWV